MPVKTRKWILIADSDEEFRNSVIETLTGHFGRDIKIVAANNGIEAISKIQNQTFHLIITSWDLDRRSGDEVVEAARGNMFNQTTPIIVMSSEKMFSIEKDFEFVNFFLKPLDNEKFTKAVQNLFSIGSTEKMISASIFSSLLDSSIAFLEEGLQRKDFKIAEMKLKKRGQPVEGDHAAVIKVYIGKVSNTFSVLCNNETLEKLRDGSEKINGTSLDVICKSLGYVILKYVLTECGIIDSNEVKTKDITQDSSILTNKQGIVVPITADGLHYTIFATTKGGD